MPIRSIKSKRKGCKPLVFFKGSPAEARENAEKLLSKAFQIAENNLPAQEIKQIKQYFVSAIEDPKRQIVYIPTSVGRIVLRIKDLKNGIVCVYQRPAIHGVRKRKSTRGKEIDSFEALKKILKSGFRTVSEKTNVFTGSAGKEINKS